MTDETNDCGECSLCCGYVSVETEEPTTIEDVDHLLWLLAHKNVQLFHDDGLYVQFITPCRHHDGNCSIYTHRPDICLEYEMKECEISGKEKRTYIKNADELITYIKTKKPEVWTAIKDSRQFAKYLDS